MYMYALYIPGLYMYLICVYLVHLWWWGEQVTRHRGQRARLRIQVVTFEKISHLTSSTSRRVFGGGGNEWSGVAMARGPPRGCIALASCLGTS